MSSCLQEFTLVTLWSVAMPHDVCSSDLESFLGLFLFRFFQIGLIILLGKVFGLEDVDIGNFESRGRHLDLTRPLKIPS